MRIKSMATIAAATLALIAGPAYAQGTATGTTTTDPALSTPLTQDREEDDNDFPWGLLGLVGLAGLLGRNKRDHDDVRTGTTTNNR